jgi:hypothetical protein
MDKQYEYGQFPLKQHKQFSLMHYYNSPNKVDLILFLRVDNTQFIWRKNRVYLSLKKKRFLLSFLDKIY